MSQTCNFVKHINEFRQSENKQRIALAIILLLLALVVTALFIIFPSIIGTPLAALLLISFLTFFPPEFIYRRMRWNFADTEHVKKSPHKTIGNTQSPFRFNLNIDEKLVSSYFRHGYKMKDLDEFFGLTDTTAFIVILNDVLIYEKYFNGFGRESVQTCYSITKSVLSALVGIAIDEGHIKSVDTSITDYLPELEKRDSDFAEITVKHLLTMSSGLGYSRTLWGDGVKALYSSDLKKTALKRAKIVDSPGECYLYNNFNTIFLGIILQRVTGMPVSDYLREKLWHPLRMEFPARWNVDSRKRNFEKTYSGLMLRAIDLAKMGRLYLNYGNWQGQQVISRDWIRVSTGADKDHQYQKERCRESILKPFFDSIDNGYYGYLWWGIQRDADNYDFLARGVNAQILYVCPKNNLIIVRHGLDYGLYTDEWIRLFYEFAGRLGDSI